MWRVAIKAHVLSIAGTSKRTNRVLWAAFLVWGCGGESAPAGTDAGPVDATVNHHDGALPLDASDDSTSTDAGQTYDTCDASSNDAGAQDGGCDPAHIVLAHRANAPCSAVGVGTYCDRLQFSFGGLDASAVPAGFVCGHELGVSTCAWQTPDGGGQTLDTDALNAACAATVALPGTQIECIVY